MINFRINDKSGKLLERRDAESFGVMEWQAVDVFETMPEAAYVLFNDEATGKCLYATDRVQYERELAEEPLETHTSNPHCAVCGASAELDDTQCTCGGSIIG